MPKVQADGEGRLQDHQTRVTGSERKKPFLFTANLTYGKQHIRWHASREGWAVLA